jgi:two-component system CheB/CheR fusion protein
MKTPLKAARERPHTIPSFPVVGIGASAGGLGAFEKFFSAVPDGRKIATNSKAEKI